MALAFDLASLSRYREGNRLEAKRAQGGLPSSIWETYSAFANTSGGIIALGIEERHDGALSICGVDAPEQLVKSFWDTVNNPNKVSANILADSDVSIVAHDAARAILISVPRAPLDTKPVYVGGNPLTGTYRRNGEGDYRCSQVEFRAMIRDSSDGTTDRTSLTQLGTDSLCPETIERYRNTLRAVRAEHPWLTLDTDDFLLRLGAIGRSAEDNHLHPTRAGLLMFGEAWQITAEFPRYFLEYRQVSSTRRWDDRIVTSSGEWSGNVFDFWLKVSVRLTEELPRPFELRDMYRVDDTPMHRALREGLANMLIHADYYGEVGSKVEQQDTRIIFVNPGTLRLAPEVILNGGISSTRNPTLMTMFNLISVGERAGSGFDGMRQGCDYAGISYPTLAERFSPDGVELTFDLAPRRREAGRAAGRIHTEERDWDDALPGRNEAGIGRRLREVHYLAYRGTCQADPEDEVMLYLEENGTATRRDIEGLLGIKSTKAKGVISGLAKKGLIVMEGAGPSTRYRIA